MRKILFLIATFLFVSVGAYASEGEVAGDKKISQEKQTVNIEKQKSAKKNFKLLKGANKKENFFQKLKKVRKIKKELKKNQTAMGKMMMAGLGLLLGGLLLYLIVTSAPILGIIVMVLGLVILLYAVLKKFF